MKLKRHIGLIALTLYGVGDILGAGIYGLIGQAAGQMGYGVWLAFLTSMVVAMLSGLSYAAVGSRFPRAAGAAFVTHQAFRLSALTYVVGLSSLASGLTSMATASRVFAGYLKAYLPFVPIEVIILGFLFFLAAVVWKGIRESMWANSVCTLIEVSGLLFIIVIGVGTLGSVNYWDAFTAQNPEGVLSPGLVLGGAVLTFYSFIGFEDILNVSEEVKNPKKTVPRALLAAILISSIIYVLISLIAVSAVPPSILKESHQPLVDVVRTLRPDFPYPLYSLVSVFAVMNTALLNFVMGSRLIYGLSKQKLLPQALSKVHHKTATPHVAIVFILMILVVLAMLGDIASLAKATSVLLLCCFIMVNLSLIWIKLRDKPPEPGTFDIPLVIPAAGFVSCIVLLYFAQMRELRLAGLILVSIVLLYLIQRPMAENLEKIDEVDS